MVRPKVETEATLVAGWRVFAIELVGLLRLLSTGCFDIPWVPPGGTKYLG